MPDPHPTPLPDPLPPAPGFADQAAALGIEFEAGDLERLGLYLALLLETNKQFNLTAITDPAEAWTRHILDSLTLIPLLAEAPEGGTVIDVGSGGGLPGLPLAITMPHLRFTLLEATGKKVAFLRDAAAALGLANVEVVQGRAEELGQDRGRRVEAAGRTEREHSRRESYDVAVARAVGPMAVIAELTVPLVKVGGQVLLIKGQRAEEELAEAKQALYLLHAHHAGTVDTPTGRVVVLEKARPTPRAYPRKSGEPKRAPLGKKEPRSAAGEPGG